jgi:hypothetical protein
VPILPRGSCREDHVVRTISAGPGGVARPPRHEGADISRGGGASPACPCVAAPFSLRARRLSPAAPPALLMPPRLGKVWPPGEASRRR